MHAVRPAWVRGGAAAQWEAWPLAPTPGVVETAGGSSTGRGRRQGLAGLAELQRGFLECPATEPKLLETERLRRPEHGGKLPGVQELQKKRGPWPLGPPWGPLSALQGPLSGVQGTGPTGYDGRAQRGRAPAGGEAEAGMGVGAPGGQPEPGPHCSPSQANGSSQGKGVPVSGKVKCSVEMRQEERQERRALEGTHGQGWSKVGCAACQQSLPKHLLEIHEAKECQEHPVECQFCELAVRLNKVDIHEHPCGRRTEVCPDCGQRIVLHMLARHRDECCGEQTRLQKGKRIPAPESNICCHYCNQMIPGNKYFHHVDRCRPISDSVTYSPVGKPDIPPSSLSSQAAEDQTSTAEKDVRPKTKNTSRFPLLSEKSTRQAPRGTNKTTDLPLKSDGKLRGSSPVEDETAYDILRRCSQCGIVLPLPTLTQHQEKCWWLASSKGKQARSSS
ncbi:XIAP-associated factor 1 isoform X2 [Tursiops truncatus]|uniref:XIAP-associated factor 1 isoform X2 n=1 Tax=Tursiops truncatus TaxID=9739 RepID=UPI003CCF51CD